MGDPEPTNPLSLFFQIALAIFLGVVVSLNVDQINWSSSMNPPAAGQTQDAQPAQVLTVIQQVDAMQLESFPAQISLHVTGYQPDGCTYPVMVDQSREGNTVTVRIYRELPPDILCTMQLVPYDETIKLDGSFEPGEYTIDVNGTIVTVTV